MGDFFFGFVHSHPFLVRILELLREHYDRSEFIDVPTAMNKVVEQVSRDPVQNSIGKQFVGNVYIPRVEFATAVNSSSYKFLFKNGDMDVGKLLENRPASLLRIGKRHAPELKIKSASPLAKIVSKFCPRSFWTYDINF